MLGPSYPSCLVPTFPALRRLFWTWDGDHWTCQLALRLVLRYLQRSKEWQTQFPPWWNKAMRIQLWPLCYALYIPISQYISIKLMLIEDPTWTWQLKCHCWLWNWQTTMKVWQFTLTVAKLAFWWTLHTSWPQLGTEKRPRWVWRHVVTIPPCGIVQCGPKFLLVYSSVYSWTPAVRCHNVLLSLWSWR